MARLTHPLPVAWRSHHRRIAMTTSLVAPEIHDLTSIKQQIDTEIDSLVAALPDPKELTPEQRRGIIARYSAVLEGNFIYWMTAAYLSRRTEAGRRILIDNLREEFAVCHPARHGGLGFAPQ